MRPPSAPVIETIELSRDFGKTPAVVDLSLTIQQGELFGLVGPDGAGKTTTLRLLAGVLDISAGRATLAGHDLARQPEAAKPVVGYMAQRFSLYGELTVVENLWFFADLYDVPRGERLDRMGRLLDFAGLADFKNRRANRLSGGMQKKLALACTLIHDPQVLLLDEPTTGVDPISRREFWAILSELHLGGTTVLVSTPYMDEADRCNRVGLLYAGRLIVCDTPRNIRAGIQGEVIELRAQEWQRAQTVVNDLPWVRQVQTYGAALHLLVDSASKRLPEVKKALRKADLPVTHIRQAPLRMEEAFLSLLSGSLQESLPGVQEEA